MRHTPDDELHAYLDQALSRSQCAEIETHLSICARCRDQRDAVAALRDRTTALLSRLAPRPLILPPPWESLKEHGGHRLAMMTWRVHLHRASRWAAMVVIAMGAGWIFRSALDPHRAAAPVAPALASIALPAPAAPTPDPTADLRRDATPVSIPVRSTGLRAIPRADADVILPAPTLHLASAVMPISMASLITETPARPSGPDLMDRLWRRIEWEEALEMAGSSLPFIEGLPVVGVLVQTGAKGERPTVIVAQQDPGGEVIQSIEGPVEKVNELLQHTDMAASAPVRTPPDYVEGAAGAVRRTIRILAVIGRLSADSLNTLARMATIR